MPAPLVAAGMYFGLPRLLGGLAEKAAFSRAENLSSQGVDPSNDTLINLLSLVPKQSGLESTLDSLRTIDFYRNTPFSEPQPLEESPSGAVVTRELPYNTGVEFISPMDDFLKYGGRDDDSGLSPLARFMEDLDRDQSYGQTDQPATEVRFDDLINPDTGESYVLHREPETQTVMVEAPRQQQGGGFAGGGLADVLRMMYAQHQR